MRVGGLLIIGFFAILTTAEAASADSLTVVPRAPNYAESDAWAAWPGQASGADAVPPGSNAPDGPTRGKVDVFFVHPTTFLSPVVGNATYDAPGIPRVAIDRTVLRFQAGAFNGCCRIFAPHYRQASLGAFFHEGRDREAAIDLAYSDVRRAFDYYLAHENNGRPFIIASHSQGSAHAMRLLQERVAGTPLQQRMVAAYVVGYAIPGDIEQAGIPICGQSRQTGCLVHWATVREGESDHPARTLIWLDGHYQVVGDRKLVCVNPLNWRRDGAAPASANLGSLPRVAPMRSMPRPLPELTGAACDDGLLRVSIPLTERWRFSDVLTLFGSYHDFDYHLFYLNIRHNAAERVAAYLARTFANEPFAAEDVSLAADH